MEKVSGVRFQVSGVPPEADQVAGIGCKKKGVEVPSV